MKRWKIKEILKEVGITLIMVLVVSLLMNHFRQPDTTHQPKSMKVTLTTGDEVELFDTRRPTVIHFWGTWCPTCRFEAPNIERLQSDEVHLVTVAVKSGSDQAIRAYMQKEGYSFPVVNDQTGALASRFDVSVFPTTFIYDREWNLKFAEVGYSTTLGLKARVELID